MSKNTKTVFKVFVIFIGSIILAWFVRSIFGDLYTATLKPVQYPGSLWPVLVGHRFEGYLIAYTFFVSFLTFFSIEKDIQRWVLALLMGPLLVMTVGLWGMYLWFAVATLFSFCVAKVAQFAIKKFKGI